MRRRARDCVQATTKGGNSTTTRVTSSEHCYPPWFVERVCVCTVRTSTGGTIPFVPAGMLAGKWEPLAPFQTVIPVSPKLFK